MTAYEGASYSDGSKKDLTKRISRSMKIGKTFGREVSRGDCNFKENKALKAFSNLRQWIYNTEYPLQKMRQIKMSGKQTFIHFSKR